ncbi:MAG: penicillin-binding protein 2 [Anaerolineae bacterium]|nr:penicillin-binding protein 2 [Anaerolineae bacterium]
MKNLGRLNILGIVLTTMTGLIFMRMIYVQFSNGGQELLKEAEANYRYEHEEIVPARGSIYDRWGNLLAGNRTVYELGINLANTERNPRTIAKHLSSLLGMDYNDVYNLASTPLKAGQQYIVLKDFVDGDTINQIQEIKGKLSKNPDPALEGEASGTLEGIEWQPHLKREYPENSLASNVLGFYAFLDRKEGDAHYGVEEEYNKLLAGNSMQVDIPIEPREAAEIPTVPPGDSLVLTIDRRIQQSVEEILDRAVEKNQAISGTIIVMDPETGEILAMATNPRINPNEYWQSNMVVETKSYNRAIDITYEPGSVFKVLTMAAAMDAGVVNADTPFNDTGSVELGGYTIYNWDRSAWGQQTMLGCMQHSLNVCLTWVAMQLGSGHFYDYMRAFGIGQYTNIDLAGEKVFPLSFPGDSNWADINLGTNSFGQGLAVTPLQMVQAVGAIANDGKMMSPHILKSIIKNGEKTDFPARQVGQPITAKTAHELTDMLTISLEEEASSALVDNYRVAGKTGTAEIPSPEGYISNVTNASFVGWGPADDPKFIVYVWLEKPKSSIWGSVVASPVFSSVVQKLVVLMDIPPDSTRQQLLMTRN